MYSGVHWTPTGILIGVYLYSEYQGNCVSITLLKVIVLLCPFLYFQFLLGHCDKLRSSHVGPLRGFPRTFSEYQPMAIHHRSLMKSTSLPSFTDSCTILKSQFSTWSATTRLSFAPERCFCWSLFLHWRRQWEELNWQKTKWWVVEFSYHTIDVSNDLPS